METGSTEKVSFSHHRIYTDVVINAAPDVEWSALTDTPSYDSWAAFLIAIEGEISDGATITAVFQTNPRKDKLTRIDHRISVSPGQSFFWAEKGPGGIRDNHHFKIEAAEDGTSRFIQTDEITGGLTWLMGARLAKMYLEGYQAFNRGLKAEVERRFKAG